MREASLCWLAAAAWLAAASLPAWLLLGLLPLSLPACCCLAGCCLLHICSRIRTAHTHPQRPARRGVFS